MNDEMKQRELEELERKLCYAMKHRTAPAGLKQRVLAQAREQRLARRGRGWMLQRIAASVMVVVLLGGIAGGFAVHREQEERRKGEAAKEQVLTALRITSKTLDRVNERITDGK